MEVTVKDVRGAQMYVGWSQYRSRELPTPAPQRQRKVAMPFEKPWWSDPETKRMRVARYKLYDAEFRFKASMKNGLCWLKRQCTWVR
ncbi:hypothetical protein CRG98_003512 [Punica granatum]|nr:hypothetical protein CRG98_003512 [Punica granatum]